MATWACWRMPPGQLPCADVTPAWGSSISTFCLRIPASCARITASAACMHSRTTHSVTHPPTRSLTHPHIHPLNHPVSHFFPIAALSLISCNHPLLWCLGSIQSSLRYTPPASRYFLAQFCSVRTACLQSALHLNPTRVRSLMGSRTARRNLILTGDNHENVLNHA